MSGIFPPQAIFAVPYPNTAFARHMSLDFPPPNSEGLAVFAYAGPRAATDSTAWGGVGGRLLPAPNS